MIILGVNDEMHDYSLSLIVNKKIYTVELERILRIKYGKYYNDKNTENIFKPNYQNILDDFSNFEEDLISHGDFSKSFNIMLNYILSGCNLSIKDIDLFVATNKNSKINYESYFNQENIIYSKSHHLSHAYSSFFLSNFENSNILVIDGEGTNYKELGHEIQSTYVGNKNMIKEIKKIYSNSFDIGIGKSYEIVSKFLGISPGKLLGLSGYGKRYFRKNNYNLFSLVDGSVTINRKYIDVFSNRGKFFREFGLNTNIFDKSTLAFVYSFQIEVEDAIIYLVKYLYNLSRSKNLCIAGGVGLNIIANTRIKNELGYNIYIPSATNDSGISLGNALYGYYNINNGINKININNFCSGNKYNNNFINNIILKYDNLVVEKISSKLIPERIGNLILKNNIIAIFSGRSEFGPRALGNRSIIANPLMPNVKNILNLIKGREKWRPFGVILLRSNLKKLFLNYIHSPYMLFVNLFKEKIYNNISHIDSTVRFQSIGNTQGLISKILKFLDKNNLFCIVNTSLNYSGEPIIESPKDAIDFFISSKLHYLLIGNFLLKKKTKVINPARNLKIYIIDKLFYKLKLYLSNLLGVQICDIFIEIDLLGTVMIKINFNGIKEKIIIEKEGLYCKNSIDKIVLIKLKLSRVLILKYSNKLIYEFLKYEK